MNETEIHSNFISNFSDLFSAITKAAFECRSESSPVEFL